jgi:hypothetical protein
MVPLISASPPEDPSHSVRVGWLIEFAPDSPLEEAGFEPSVPG